MAPTNVSSCVLSIVDSFTSGLDVLRRLRESHGRKRLRRDKPSKDDELRLARSLQQGREDIGREYQRSLCSVGNQFEQFARGDGIAQNSLAEILLKLNTGLVAIINTFLSKGKQNGPLDYSSLTDLSERSRSETCRALRRWCRRMQSRLPKRLGDKQDRRRPETQSTSKVSRASNQRGGGEANVMSIKVRGPMLARVVVANSSRPSVIAMVRPGERRKASNPSTSSSKVLSTASLPLLANGQDPSLRLPNHPRRDGSQEPVARKKQSALEISLRDPSSDTALRTTRSTPGLTASMAETPVPRVEPWKRKPTPTYYSVQTTDTKIGEIPIHKWAEPYDFEAMSMLNKDATEQGWPLADLALSRKKKRRGLFGLFRKNPHQA